MILAGGKDHLIEAPEDKEDDADAAWRMLLNHNVSENDIVIGISASGTTPFVLSALKECKKNKILTGFIVSNAETTIVAQADFPIVVITGAEFISGST